MTSRKKADKISTYKCTEQIIRLNIETKDHKTAFHIACQNGHFSIAELLVEKSSEFKIDLNSKEKYYGATAFHLACVNFNKRIIDMMVESVDSFNINLKIKDKNGMDGFTAARFLLYK